MSLVVEVLPETSVVTTRFATELGWAELSWQGIAVARFRWLGKRSSQSDNRHNQNLSAAQQELVQDITDFAAGMRIDFSQVELHLGNPTPFQRDIWLNCQKIPYGEVLTYGQLAAKAGRPGAARAVGSAMCNNPIPIIIPCHRVIAAGNKIGGFTNPDGIRFKRRLLEMEGDGSTNWVMPKQPPTIRPRPR